MKNQYEIQIWEHHLCKEKKLFTNKAKAKKWIKDSGYKIISDMGWCFIQPVVNGREVELSELSEWY